jgi:diphthine-ammonia ligase
LESFGTFIAGQIPLIPHTMALPKAGSGEGGMEEFKLQVVLASQHLWRVGREMRVGWFTSGVAYLPRCAGMLSPISTTPLHFETCIYCLPELVLFDSDVLTSTVNDNHNTIQHQAHIASQAWEALHAPTPSSSEEDVDAPVDLWENKHYAGKASIGALKSERALPDFDLITNESSFSTLPTFEDPDLKREGRASTVPPVFVVEVEELPRGSMVEWHAHMGIGGESGSVKVSSPYVFVLNYCTNLASAFLQRRS